MVEWYKILVNFWKLCSNQVTLKISKDENDQEFYIESDFKSRMESGLKVEGFLYLKNNLNLDEISACGQPFH